MRFIQFKLVGPAVIAMAFLVAGMGTIPYFGISQIDAALRERNQTLVKRNIELWISDIEFSLTAWTIWDDSIAHIDNRFDFDWTDRNIGASLLGTSRTRFVAVLDGTDELIYWRTDDSVKRRGFFERGADAVVADASALVSNVRARELGRNYDGIPSPLTISRIEVRGDDAVLLTASLFQPDFGTAKPKAERAPILVTAMPISGSLQDFFGTRFLLDDPRISTLDEVSPERARAEIAVGHDGQVEVLSWRPPTPAADLVYRSLPLILTVGALLMAAALFTLSVSRTAARTLLANERRMRHAATHDFLTGLANRSLLEHDFNELRAIGPVAVACLDLDGFKTVNDTYGHAVGDELLKAVAQRLTAGTRENDRLFRLGGDEFAILMPDVSANQAQDICHRLAISLSHPIKVAGLQLSIAASFGIRLVKEDDISCNIALADADTALYRAKFFGRGLVVFFGEEPGSAAREVNRRRSA